MAEEAATPTAVVPPPQKAIEGRLATEAGGRLAVGKPARFVVIYRHGARRYKTGCGTCFRTPVALLVEVCGGG